MTVFEAIEVLKQRSAGLGMPLHLVAELLALLCAQTYSASMMLQYVRMLPSVQRRHVATIPDGAQSVPEEGGIDGQQSV